MSAPTTPVYTAEEEKYILRNKDGVPVGVKPHQKWTPFKIALWVGISLLGALGWTMLAIIRGEEVNSIWFVITAICTYAIGYRFYALYIQRKIMIPDDTNATPAERINNGRDFDPTNRVVLYGHHFAAIAGAGPLVGPVLAAQMGYLPGTLWIIFGVLIAGAVQDMLVLFFSMRRGGRSLGKMAQDEIGKIGGAVATVIVLVMLMIVLAVLAMVCKRPGRISLGRVLRWHDHPIGNRHGPLAPLRSTRQDHPGIHRWLLRSCSVHHRRPLRCRISNR